MSAMIDCGSEVNLIGDCWLQSGRYEVGEFDMNITGMTGHALNVGGAVELSFSLEDGYKISIVAVLVKESAICVLGLPFLRENKVVLDHGHLRLYVRNGTYRMYNLHQRTMNIQARGVVVENAPLIPEMLQEATKSVNTIVKAPLQEILVHYRDTWAGGRIGRTSVIEHNIDLTSHKPVCCGFRKYSLEQQKIMDEEVESMLKDGVIRESQSPYASGVVLVKKKTGE